VERRAQPDAVDQRDRPAGGEDEQDRGVGDVNEPEERETEPAGQEGDHLPDGDPIGNALEDRFSKRRHVQEAGTNAEYHDRPVLRRAGSPVSAWTNTAKAGRVSASVTNSPRRLSGTASSRRRLGTIETRGASRAVSSTCRLLKIFIVCRNPEVSGRFCRAPCLIDLIPIDPDVLQAGY